ncbi:MAG: hypothetical protein EP318_01805 [Rhodobacteraceae bacterium]|nr:MAG: hypothetical protein EP318_01805 [Paracoccaceae bacterium]
MKPDFALLLSFDGIALLRRASAYGEAGDGWYLLGTVSPDVPDLPAALADLRERAMALAPGSDPEVKLVLPTEQVKFLDIESPDSDISVAEAVEAALDGATPYSIDELVYDIHKDGAQVHIAAVARETLDEAESFATGHGFLPLGYVSDISPEAGFTREPFFGPTQLALTTLTPGVTVQGDDAPISILDGPPPDLDAAVAKPQTPPQEKSAAKAEPESVPVTEAVSPASEPEPVKPAPKPEATVAPKAEPKPAKEDPKAEATANTALDPVESPESKPAAPKPAAQSDVPAKSPAPKAEPTKSAPADKAPEDKPTAKPAAKTPDPEDKGSEDKAVKQPEPENKPSKSAKPAPADKAPPAKPAAEAPPSDKPAAKDAPKDTPAAKTQPSDKPAAKEPPSDQPAAKDTPKDKPVEKTQPSDQPVAEAPPKVQPAAAAPKDEPVAKVPSSDQPGAKDTPKDKPAAKAQSNDKPAAAAAPKAQPGAAAPSDKPAAKPAPKDTPAAKAPPLPGPKAAPARTVPPAPKPLPVDAPLETPGFSSIRAQREAPPPRPATSLSAVPDPATPAPRLNVTPVDEPRDIAAELAAKARESLTNRPKPEPLPKAPAPIGTPATEAPAELDEKSAARTIGFASRRAAKKKAANDRPGALRKPKFGRGKGAAAALASGAVMDESDRMTVFGARGQQKVGGKPRFLGLILTTVLLLLLLAVAAVASIFLEDGLAGLFRKSAETPVASATVPAVIESGPIDPAGTEAPPQPVVDPLPETALALPGTEAVPDPQDPSAINVAALSEGVPAMSRELVDDQVDGLSVPFEAEQLSPEQAEARYAATGIWQRAPLAPDVPDQAEIGDVYVASIDPGVSVGDAVAIPSAREATTDVAPSAQINPYPPDAGLTFDENGLIEPTPEGVRHPAGFLLVLGPPPVKPPLRPGTEVPQPAALPEAAQPGTAAEPAEEAPAAEPEPETSADPVVIDPTLDGLRPRPRPGDLEEQNERANLGGISLDELRQKRPKVRPEQAEDKTEAEKDIEASALAVAASVTPKRRPSNIDTLVKRAEEAAAAAPPAASTTSSAAVAPRTVTPRIPTTTTVAAAATEKNALNLRRVNLIGVYGKPSSRRALIRLANGRYKKVKVGDRIDGGRVSAIGEGQLSYVKGGRNVVLRMPRG